MPFTISQLASPRINSRNALRLLTSHSRTPQSAIQCSKFYISRDLGTSGRGITNSTRASQSRQNVSFGVGFAILSALAGTLYKLYAEEPLRLESDRTEWVGADVIDQRYLPPRSSCTIQQANEILRWEETSQMVGLGSGVQRFDSVRIASNMPCEDQCVAASGHDEDEVKWLLWGGTLHFRFWSFSRETCFKSLNVWFCLLLRTFHLTRKC